ncbi:Hypothetical protein SMAX5B_010571 [Scophthalmus maximus]|uniref:Uncharacterized protein n=1 Tax=Scophthalmus maximus TaxID=52904 RepID=A0A2U9B2L8_SCOMX|nr:Hypothetical protein SMAX5B_010571 [Scophthalmus maximus]
MKWTRKRHKKRDEAPQEWDKKFPPAEAALVGAACCQLLPVVLRRGESIQS